LSPAASSTNALEHSMRSLAARKPNPPRRAIPIPIDRPKSTGIGAIDDSGPCAGLLITAGAPF
jgi:hypothetical protein